MDVIVQFLNGNGDATIISGSNHLQQRLGGVLHCPIIDVPFALEAAPGTVILALQAILVNLGANDRVYLRGHGNWTIRTLGGWSPARVARLLCANGLAIARVISITGCNCGRGSNLGEPESMNGMAFQELKAVTQLHLQNSVNSFAGVFHLALNTAPFLITAIPVTARTSYVDVDNHGHKTVRVGPADTRKSGTGSAMRTKLRFRWNGAHQEAKWDLDNNDDWHQNT